MKKFLTRLLLIATVVAPVQVFSQNPWKNAQTWIDLNFSTPVNTKLKLGGTTGIKSKIDFSNWHVWHIRPRVYYDVSENLEIFAGVGIFENLYSGKSLFTETRIEQQVFFAGPKFQKFKIDHRFRFEQRYIKYRDIGEDVMASEWKGRIRYRIRAKTKDFILLNRLKNFHISIGGETYMPVTRDNSINLTEQQIYFGFGQSVFKDHKYEINFLWQGKIHPQRPQGINSSDYVGLRLRYFWIRS